MKEILKIIKKMEKDQNIFLMVYVGEFKDNKKDGKGKYIYKDDSHYDGEFIDDLFDGNGKYFWKEKNIKDYLKMV